MSVWKLSNTFVRTLPYAMYFCSHKVKFGRPFFGCGEMWYGITINTAGALDLGYVFSGCNIEDAYVGITLDELGGSYVLTNNTFRNNYIGISNLRKSSTLIRNLNASITQNTFLQSANLATRLFELNSIPMTDYPNAYAGIAYTGVASAVGVGSSPALANLFTCLQNGIVSIRSNLISKNNNFQDLGKNGILTADGTMGVYNCEFSLDGDLGISTNGTTLRAQSNLFTGNWTEGIQSLGNKNGEKVMIEGNFFTIATTKWVRGIYLDLPQAKAGLNTNISRNFFTVTSCSAAGLNGIYVSDLADDTGESIIVSNDFNINYAGGPIHAIVVSLGNSDNFKILSNHIDYGTISNTGVQNFGILVTKNNAQTLAIENEVDRNEISGIAANLIFSFSANCGIHVTGGVSNTDFCDNTVDFSRFGLHFQSNNDVRLRENHINHHHYGLYIQGATGIQHGRGNLWNLDPNASSFAARNDNGFPSNSEFVVDPVEEGNMLPWLPPTAKIFPDPSVPATNWFREDDITLDHCVPTVENPLPRALTQYEKALVLGTSPTTGAELWNLKLDAYTKLLIFPSLRPTGSPEATFFNGLNNTSIAYFAQVTQQVRNALEMSTGDQSAFDTYRVAIEEAFDSLMYVDESISYASTTNLTEAWFAQRAVQLQQVATNASYEIALESTRNLQVSTALLSALAFNTSITTTQPYESAKKTLNELRIRRLLGQPMTLSLYQQALALAQQNPATTGYATEEVILYLAPCDQILYSDSDEEAPQEREESVHPDTSIAVLSLPVAPNPSSGVTEVSLPHHHGGLLKIYSTHGLLLKTVMVAPGASKISLNLESFAIGLYMILLEDQKGKILGRAKVSISHQFLEPSRLPAAHWL